MYHCRTCQRDASQASHAHSDLALLQGDGWGAQCGIAFWAFFISIGLLARMKQHTVSHILHMQGRHAKKDLRAIRSHKQVLF